MCFFFVCIASLIRFVCLADVVGVCCELGVACGVVCIVVAFCVLLAWLFHCCVLLVMGCALFVGRRSFGFGRCVLFAVVYVL